MTERQPNVIVEPKTLGIVLAVLGLLAMLAPGVTGFSVVILVGLLVIAAGVVRIIWAFKALTAKRGIFLFALGGLTLFAGVAMVVHPVYASGILTLILTLYFLLDGIAEICAAYLIKPAKGWGWELFGGVISFVLGIMIWSQFPLSGAWAIGILLGVKLLIIGLVMMGTGSVHLRHHEPDL